MNNAEESDKTPENNIPYNSDCENGTSPAAAGNEVQEVGGGETVSGQVRKEGVAAAADSSGDGAQDTVGQVESTENNTRSPDRDASDVSQGAVGAVGGAASHSQEDIETIIMCTICRDIIFMCVTLQPCMHSFCQVCYHDWRKQSLVCPTCRRHVETQGRNHMIMNMIEVILKAQPALRRDPAEISDLKQRADAIDREERPSESLQTRNVRPVAVVRPIVRSRDRFRLPGPPGDPFNAHQIYDERWFSEPDGLTEEAREERERQIMRLFEEHRPDLVSTRTGVRPDTSGTRSSLQRAERHRNLTALNNFTRDIGELRRLHVPEEQLDQRSVLRRILDLYESLVRRRREVLEEYDLQLSRTRSHEIRNSLQTMRETWQDESQEELDRLRRNVQQARTAHFNGNRATETAIERVLRVTLTNWQNETVPSRFNLERESQRHNVTRRQQLLDEQDDWLDQLETDIQTPLQSIERIEPMMHRFRTRLQQHDDRTYRSRQMRNTQLSAIAEDDQRNQSNFDNGSLYDQISSRQLPTPRPSSTSSAATEQSSVRTPVGIPWNSPRPRIQEVPRVYNLRTPATGTTNSPGRSSASDTSRISRTSSASGQYDHSEPPPTRGSNVHSASSEVGWWPWGPSGCANNPDVAPESPYSVFFRQDADRNSNPVAQNGSPEAPSRTEVSRPINQFGRSTPVMSPSPVVPSMRSEETTSPASSMSSLSRAVLVANNPLNDGEYGELESCYRYNVMVPGYDFQEGELSNLHDDYDSHGSTERFSSSFLTGSRDQSVTSSAASRSPTARFSLPFFPRSSEIAGTSSSRTSEANSITPSESSIEDDTRHLRQDLEQFEQEILHLRDQARRFPGRNYFESCGSHTSARNMPQQDPINVCNGSERNSPHRYNAYSSGENVRHHINIQQSLSPNAERINSIPSLQYNRYRDATSNSRLSGSNRLSGSKVSGQSSDRHSECRTGETSRLFSDQSSILSIEPFVRAIRIPPLAGQSSPDSERSTPTFRTQRVSSTDSQRNYPRRNPEENVSGMQSPFRYAQYEQNPSSSNNPSPSSNGHFTQNSLSQLSCRQRDISPVSLSTSMSLSSSLPAYHNLSSASPTYPGTPISDTSGPIYHILPNSQYSAPTGPALMPYIPMIPVNLVPNTIGTLSPPSREQADQSTNGSQPVFNSTDTSNATGLVNRLLETSRQFEVSHLVQQQTAEKKEYGEKTVQNMKNDSTSSDTESSISSSTSSVSDPCWKTTCTNDQPLAAFSPNLPSQSESSTFSDESFSSDQISDPNRMQNIFTGTVHSSAPGSYPPLPSTPSSTNSFFEDKSADSAVFERTTFDGNVAATSGYLAPLASTNTSNESLSSGQAADLYRRLQAEPSSSDTESHGREVLSAVTEEIQRHTRHLLLPPSHLTSGGHRCEEDTEENIEGNTEGDSTEGETEGGDQNDQFYEFVSEIETALDNLSISDEGGL